MRCWITREVAAVTLRVSHVAREQVAEEVEAELTKYKAAVANVTSKTQVTPEDVGVQSTDVRRPHRTTMNVIVFHHGSKRVFLCAGNIPADNSSFRYLSRRG